MRAQSSATIDVVSLACIANQNRRKQVFFYFHRMRARASCSCFDEIARAPTVSRAKPGGAPAGKKIASGC